MPLAHGRVQGLYYLYDELLVSFRESDLYSGALYLPQGDSYGCEKVCAKWLDVYTKTRKANLYFTEESQGQLELKLFHGENEVLNFFPVL